jgi:WD40 repeat protein
LIKSFVAHEEGTYCLTLLKNGLVASSGYYNIIKIWDLNNQRMLKSFQADDLFFSLVVASNGFLVGSYTIGELILVLDHEKFNNEVAPLTTNLGR